MAQKTLVKKPKNKNLVYIDDQSIDDNVKCPICFDPFDDPVTTPCDHTFCRECIESSIKHNSDRKCPTCRHGPLTNSSLKPANRIISNIIDRYTVKCLTCKQTNIQRGNFEEHSNKHCPKVEVSCPAANIRCPWIGPKDALEGHKLLCIYHQMRPTFSELFSTNEKLQKQIDTQATQIKSIQDA